MQLRQLLLRVMLWSLAFAAVAGVLAVLLGGGDLVWRTIGTGVVTAVACGLMLAVSKMVDRRESRASGLLGMTVVILEFVAALLLIWEIPQALWGVRAAGEVESTMFVCGAAGAIAMAFLTRMRKSRDVAACWTGLIVTFAAFAACMIGIWYARHSAHHDAWWETGGTLALTGGLAVVCLIGLGSAARPWRWVGIGGAAVAWIMWLADIWVGVGSDPGFVIFCTLLSAAVAVAYTNLVLLCPLPVEQRWVLTGTVVMALVTAGLIDLLIIDDKLFEVGVPGELLGRLAAAAGILTGCGSLALCVLGRLYRKVDQEILFTEVGQIMMVCPRCRRKQDVSVGDSSCAGCGLRISIRIEEPRCRQCDYLLYRLTSDCCPECGTLIAEQGPVP